MDPSFSPDIRLFQIKIYLIQKKCPMSELSEAHLLPFSPLIKTEPRCVLDIVTLCHPLHKKLNHSSDYLFFVQTSLHRGRTMGSRQLSVFVDLFCACGKVSWRKLSSWYAWCFLRSFSFCLRLDNKGRERRSSLNHNVVFSFSNWLTAGVFEMSQLCK